MVLHYFPKKRMSQGFRKIIGKDWRYCLFSFPPHKNRYDNDGKNNMLCCAGDHQINKFTNGLYIKLKNLAELSCIAESNFEYIYT